MRRQMLLTALSGFLSAAQPAIAACGHDLVAVAGDEEEIAAACVALDGVLDYFAAAGFAVEPVVTISFQDEVWYDLDASTGRRVKVSGCFDMRRAMIEITRWNIEPATERRPWGVEWGKPIVASILQHELVHMATIAVLGDQQHMRLGGAWHEFVAYAVQFELMEPSMRERILAGHPTVTPFESPWAANEMTYAAEPDNFGLRAYLYAQERGGMAFIKEILESRVEVGTGETSHICPWR
jgi:hypothetical protein